MRDHRGCDVEKWLAVLHADPLLGLRLLTRIMTMTFQDFDKPQRKDMKSTDTI